MEEELIDILYEAYSQGASPEDLEKVKMWYQNGKTIPQDTTQAPTEQPVAPQEQQSAIPAWMQNVKTERGPENTPSHPTSAYAIVKGAHDAVADVIPPIKGASNVLQYEVPKAYEGVQSFANTESFDEQILNEYRKKVNKVTDRRSVGMYPNFAASSKDDTKLMEEAIQDYKRLHGEKEYERQKAAKEAENINKKLESHRKTEKINREQEIFMGDTNTSMLQPGSVGGFIEAAGYNVGQTLGSGVASMLTGGAFSGASESFGIREEALQKKAAMLSEQLKTPVTVEDLIKAKMDEDVNDQAIAFGMVNMALDMIGISKVFGPAIKSTFGRAAVEKLAERGLIKRFLEPGGTEALTEFLQETSTQYGSGIASGLSPEESINEVDWFRSAEAAAAGFTGGTVVGGVSSPSKPKTVQDNTAKLSKAETEVKKTTFQEAVATDITNEATKGTPQEAKAAVDDIVAQSVVDIKNILAGIENIEDEGKAKEKEAKASKEKIVEQGDGSVIPESVAKERTELQKKMDKIREKEAKEGIATAKAVVDEEGNTVFEETSPEDIEAAKDEKTGKPAEVGTKATPTDGGKVQSKTKQTGTDTTGGKTTKSVGRGKKRRAVKPTEVKEEPTPVDQITEEDYTGERNENLPPTKLTKQDEKESQKRQEKDVLTDGKKEQTAVEAAPKPVAEPKVAPITAKKEKVATAEVKGEEKPTQKTQPVKTSGQVEGNIQSKSTGTVATEKAAKKEQAAIETEKVKFNNMFENRRKFPRPLERIKRLQHLLDNTISKAKYPEAHEELKAKIKAEIEKQSTREKNTKEDKERVKEKKIEKKDKKVAAVSPTKDPTDSDKKKKQTRRLDSLYTKVASALDSNNEGIINQAVESVNEYRKSEGLKELSPEKIREKAKAELYQTRKKNITKAKEELGIDDDSVVDDLLNPEESVSLGDDTDTKGSFLDRWKNPSILTRAEYIDNLKERLSKVKSYDLRIWQPIVDKILDVISGMGNLHFILADSASGMVAGEAIRSENGVDYYIVLGRDRHRNTTELHELVHIIDFLGNRILPGSFDAVGQVYEDFINQYSEIVDTIWGKVRKYKGIESAWSKLTNEEQAIYLATGKLIGNVDTTVDPMEVMAQIFDNLQANASNPELLSNLFSEQPIYGITNQREFVAEAISNSAFATLLAAIDRGVAAKGPKINLFKRVLDAIVDVVNNFINFANEEFGVNMNQFEIPTTSYLANVVGELDAAFEAAKSFIEGGGPVPEASREFTTESAFLKATGKNAKYQGVIDSILKTAKAQKLKSIKALKTLVAQIEAQLPNPLPASVKAAITRNFGNYLAQQKLLNNLPAIIQAMKNTQLYDYSPGYGSIVKDIENIDISKLDENQLASFATAVNHVASMSTQSVRKGMKTIQKLKNLQDVDTVTNLEYREFAKGLRKYFTGLVNFPSLLSYISKYNKEAGATLMQIFHNSLAKPYSDAQLSMGNYMESLNKLAIENHLGKTNFKRLYYYGILLREGVTQDVIDKERQYIFNKIDAVASGRIKDIKVDEVQDELAMFNEIADQLLNNVNPLSAGEQKYYDFTRQILDSIYPAIKFNTEVVWGKKFKSALNYIPSIAMGSLGEDVNPNAHSLLAALSGPNYFNSAVASTVSMHTHLKTGGKGVYYMTNIHEIMAKYLNSTLFDVYGTYNIQKLNGLFHGDNVVALNKALTPSNVETMKETIKRGIRYAIRPTPSYSAFTRAVVKAKNWIQTGKMGTTGQFITQYVGMLPASITAVGPSAFSTALKFQLELINDQSKNDHFSKQISQYAGELGIRDFLFERFDSPADIAAEATWGRLRRLSSKLEKKTVTGVLSMSDKLSARLTWMGALVEAGADLTKMSTWTPDRLAKADLKLAQTQNVSSGLFAPSVLYRENGSDALLSIALFAYKSFAMNSMTNFWLSAPSAITNSGARNVATTQLASALGYGLTSYGVGKLYGGLIGLLFNNDDEEEDEKSILNNLYEASIGLLFGGLPSVFEAFIRYMATEQAGTYIFGEKAYKDGKFKWQDPESSPIYGPRNVGDIAEKTMGPFERLIITGIDFVDVTNDLLKGKDVTPARKSATLGKLIAEYVSLLPLPFRGDIGKVVRSEVNKEAAKNRKRKKTKSQSTKITR